jgi:hypothetical protein
MSQNQVPRSSGEDEESEFNNRLIPLIAMVVVIIVVVAAVMVVYHPDTSNTTTPTTKSEVIMANGTFLIYPGGVSGPNGPHRTPSFIGQSFIVFSNMTDIHVYGSFTSNQSVFTVLQVVGPWNTSATDELPVPTRNVSTSSAAKQGSISISLPTPSNSMNDDMYILTFNMATSIATEVNVTSLIVLAYNPA